MQAKAAGKGKRFNRTEWSWIMYDWANSIYATNIMAAIFPTIFVSIAGDAGDIWWGYGTSIATFAVALLAPVLGALADRRGMKKKLFTVFMLIGVVFTFLIALVMNNWKLMLAGYILSRIGFSGSCLFYDSFLTDVTTDDRMDKVSSWGYAMGYIGGSTIPFLISIAVLLALGYGNPIAQKFSIIITSVWWLVFSIPFLRNVEQVHCVEKTEGDSLGKIFRNVLKTAREISARRGLLLFMVAYFFYIDGVGTIISISTAYGTVLGLGTVGMILALLVTQIVAMPCSILFANIAEKVTARKALIGAILIYTLICIVGFYMGFSLEPHQAAYEEAVRTEYAEPLADLKGEEASALREDVRKILSAKDAAKQLNEKQDALTAEQQGDQEILRVFQAANAFLNGEAGQETGAAGRFRKAVSLSTILFWAMAVLVGTVQGGIQAVSRSYFGKLIPKARSNEFFGFFDIFGKFASVLGPFLYSVIGGWTGRSSYGVLALIVLFLIGLVIMIRGKDAIEAQSAES